MCRLHCAPRIRRLRGCLLAILVPVRTPLVPYPVNYRSRPRRAGSWQLLTLPSKTLAGAPCQWPVPHGTRALSVFCPHSTHAGSLMSCQHAAYRSPNRRTRRALRNNNRLPVFAVHARGFKASEKKKGTGPSPGCWSLKSWSWRGSGGCILDCHCILFQGTSKGRCADHTSFL